MSACYEKVLLVDDEQSILLGSRTLLRSAGIMEVLTLDDSRKVMPLIEREEVDVVVLDLFMPYLGGRELLAEISREHPHIPIVVITAADELETAVDCMKAGAFDYLVKPVERTRLISSVKKAIEICRLKNQMSDLKKQFFQKKVEAPETFSSIITVSEKMTSIFQYIEVVARSNEAVLVTGETGVGKELVARAVHKASGLKGNFVPVNVAGLDDTLFSDTLFGHHKGAFTGAEKAREGMIAQAAGGTLFLDEIGDLPEVSQVKLLRLLQEREYYAIGSDVPRKSNARIVAANNRCLRDLVQQGKFRKDLYYRLCTHYVTIPPLRERIEDIPHLLDHFLKKAANALGKEVPLLPSQAIPLLANYAFPGNVRELEAMVHDAVARHKSGTLSLESFKRSMKAGKELNPGAAAELPAAGATAAPAGPLPTLKEAEEILVREALRRAQGNQGIAASLLGITRTALNKRLKKEPALLL
ncbi:sigma-54 dependent transcriptional regulator [Geomonas sp. RF6]|uniref:sigma-54-dependent transcriptional regulator n=1 Tax=Geomonas sp. RF6 TaxID=2897342 RepID=UPI001E46123C|nr:sigma-54 dependent transcriptional regulator [Geomonas sp. RF6]UFS70777.1 sigma-54 dependent transcriptional regulator [Geomonas sp. RF6]